MRWAECVTTRLWSRRSLAPSLASSRMFVRVTRATDCVSDRHRRIRRWYAASIPRRLSAQAGTRGGVIGFCRRAVAATAGRQDGHRRRGLRPPACPTTSVGGQCRPRPFAPTRSRQRLAPSNASRRSASAVVPPRCRTGDGSARSHRRASATLGTLRRVDDPGVRRPDGLQRLDARLTYSPKRRHCEQGRTQPGGM